MKFKYVWLLTEPIDFFSGLQIADSKNTEIVINQMPESPRDYAVYVFYVPYHGQIVPVYLCKADNNGTTYLFSKYDVVKYTNDIIPF